MEPRQTGKSTLMGQMQPDFSINLADEREFVQFAADPGELFARLERSKPNFCLLAAVLENCDAVMLISYLDA